MVDEAQTMALVIAADDPIIAVGEKPATPGAASLPLPEWFKVGSPKTATFVCVRRASVSEYADALLPVLTAQFILPAAASKAVVSQIDGLDVVVFNFPTNPGFVEYDVLIAYLTRALAT